MAGDWLKVEKITPDKPETLQIAEQLHISPESAFLALFRVWCWADSVTQDGNARVTLVTLDSVSRHVGFGAAMVAAGWLSQRQDGFIVFPRFTRHMGQSAKRRALTAERVKRHRAQECNATDVTESLPEQSRAEQSRECLKAATANSVVRGEQDANAAAAFLSSPSADPATRETLQRFGITDPILSRLASNPRVDANRVIREWLTIKGEVRNRVGVLVTRLQNGSEATALSTKDLYGAVQSGAVRTINGTPVAPEGLLWNNQGLQLNGQQVVGSRQIRGARLG